MPSTSTVREYVVHEFVKELPEHEKKITWDMWFRIDNFHYENIGTYLVGIVIFLVSQIGFGLLFAEVTERGVRIQFWSLCVSLAAAMAAVLWLRIRYIDPRTKRRLDALRREIYGSHEKRNAFRFLCRTVRDLMPQRVLAACE